MMGEVYRESCNPKYYPDFYLREKFEDLKRVIVGPSDEMTTDERWVTETKWLADRIKFDDDGLVIDYGCGVGRIAKEFNNPVLGIDMSRSMRVNADVYVNKPTFSVITPQMFKVLVSNDLKVSGAISIWALQHVLNIKEAVYLIMQAIKPGGTFWLMDLCKRRVPHVDDRGFMWGDDSINIIPLIEQWCDLETTEFTTIYGKDTYALMKYRRHTK